MPLVDNILALCTYNRDPNTVPPQCSTQGKNLTRPAWPGLPSNNLIACHCHCLWHAPSMFWFPEAKRQDHSQSLLVPFPYSVPLRRDRRQYGWAFALTASALNAVWSSWLLNPWLLCWHIILQPLFIILSETLPWEIFSWRHIFLSLMVEKAYWSALLT